MTAGWQGTAKWSLIAGLLIAALLSLFHYWQRQRAHKLGNASSESMGLLFLLEVVMGASFFALLFTLGEMARDGFLPNGLRWFLTWLAGIAVAAAVGVGHYGYTRSVREAKVTPIANGEKKS